MGSHPFNLAIRFLLEMAALATTGIWGWKQGDGIIQYLLAVGLPVLAAVIWGTFAVPDDPSRSGKAPVPAPGIIRLIIELAIFGFAAWALYDMAYMNLCWIFGGIVIVHYVISYDRIRWLFSR